MNSRDEFHSSDPGWAGSHEFIHDLKRHLSTLTAIVQSVSDEARLIDASLDDTHEVASHLGRLVTHRVFGDNGPLPASAYPDIYRQFERARSDESDVYEVYADDLERHQRRRRKDLTIADSDADKSAVVKRRRTYLAILFDLHTQISVIDKRLTAR